MKVWVSKHPFCCHTPTKMNVTPMADHQHGVRGSSTGVSLIVVGVRQQNGCFDTHTFIQFSTYVQFELIEYSTEGGIYNIKFYI